MADNGVLKAAVLGCGPAGLLAVHGIVRAAEAAEREVEIKIFSQKRKSPLFGCQYLHRAIPGLELPNRRVDYRLQGSIAGYREKVYGSSEDVAVSPELLEEDHWAWDIRAAYDQLWERYELAIHDYFLTPGSLRLLFAKLYEEQFDIYISTVPAPVICLDRGCTFDREEVWAQGDAPELGRWANTPVELPEGTILCSGREEDEWYRVSRVFGHHTIEWPAEAVTPVGASRVTKPLKTDCECHPQWHRSGRYATWKKGVLAHESYRDGMRLTRNALR